MGYRNADNGYKVTMARGDTLFWSDNGESVEAVVKA